MEEQVIEVIAEQLSMDKSKITGASNLVEDLKADSLDIAALMLELEEKYKIEIPDEELVNLRTFSYIADFFRAIQ